MANAKIKTIRSFEDNPTAVVIDWADGEQTTHAMGDLDEAIVAQCAWHGLKQKLGDSHAATKGEKITVATARALTIATFDHMVAGDWSAKRTTEAFWTKSRVIEALQAVFGRDADECETVFQAARQEDETEADAAKRFGQRPELKKWKLEREMEKLNDQTEDSDSLAALFE